MTPLAASISLKLHLMTQLEVSFTIVTCLLYRPPIGVRKRQQIIGIVSFGHKCAAVGKPGKTELPQAIPA
jgi:hypothetical protein